MRRVCLLLAVTLLATLTLAGSAHAAKRLSAAQVAKALTTKHAFVQPGSKPPPDRAALNAVAAANPSFYLVVLSRKLIGAPTPKAAARLLTLAMQPTNPQATVGVIQGGKLGGRDTEIIVADDELKPDVALTKVKGLLERDKVDFVAGIVFSNILQAVFRPVTESETFLIGANAGTSTFAGKGCSPYFFSTSWQNDQIHEVMGKYAQDKGFKSAFLLTPNYQAGKDSVAGFKRHFKGEVVDEVYTKLGNLDFSAELAKIAAAKPEVVFTFMPGGMGVNLVKQFKQAGLDKNVTFLSAFTVDETTLPATKDDAVGLFSSSQWTPDLDNPANKAFVAAYEAKYGYVPSLYSSQGYDAAQLIDSAVKAVKG